MTNGCNKLDVYDWLNHMDMPANYIPFNVVEVRFKGSKKDFYINSENLYLEMGEPVAVETATGGYDVGFVSLTGELVRLQLKKNKLEPSAIEKRIFRKATANDMDKYQAAKDLEWETMHRARKLALDLGLSMKLSDVDYQGDKTKATFYYTAEGRVDFRELIKKMAEAFRIRIEMRQIGMRQEASRLGGIGSCGRELCCSTWLTDFKTVSTAAARYQNLSLNTLKLAGQCGKLKCCLNYELDTYMDALRDIPNDIERLETKRGVARLQKTDIFKRMMWFSYPDDENWIPLLIDRVKEIAHGNKEGFKPEDLIEIQEEEIKEEVKTVKYDYENVVGQDSLTRLDEKNKKKKRSSGRKRNKNKQQSTDGKAVQKLNDGQGKVEKGQRRPKAEDSGVKKGAGKTAEEGKPKNNRRRYRGKKGNVNKDSNTNNGNNGGKP
nr:regulatory iron-sulfur-containing complex subunit RicT [Olivibacter sp. SDN3]